MFVSLLISGHVYNFASNSSIPFGFTYTVWICLRSSGSEYFLVHSSRFLVNIFPKNVSFIPGVDQSCVYVSSSILQYVTILSISIVYSSVHVRSLSDFANCEKSIGFFIVWLRRCESNTRPQGYEPCELPLLYSAIYHPKVDIGLLECFWEICCIELEFFDISDIEME